MNYPASFQDFFKSPKWTMNLLLGAVCGIIPVVGVMVLKGWLLNGFWGRTDERPETFPDFTFDNFGKKLERGLWPALILLVVGLVVMVPVLVVVSIVLALLLGGGSSGMLGLAINVIVVGVGAVLSFFLLPVVLRASLMQDFGAGFDLPFVKRFLSLTKTELATTALVLGSAGLVVTILGKIMCLGLLLMVAAIPVIAFAWAHLSKQLYTLYLSRGGEPLVISPKLQDAPVEPPPAPPPSAV